MTTGNYSTFEAQDNKYASVSVCICTRNRAGSLANTIESVLTSKFRSDRSVELILIDNDSDDSTNDFVASYKNTVITMR